MNNVDRIMAVIVALSVVALICLGGVIYLAARSLGVPDVLVATAGAAVGALGSILARPSSTDAPG